MGVDLTDVCEAYDALIDWIQAGGENEDRGDELTRDFDETLKAFCLSFGSVEDAIDFVTANTSMELSIVQGQVAVPLPVPRKDNAELRFIDLNGCC